MSELSSFEKFADKLAYQCMEAMNVRGLKIRRGRDALKGGTCCCPLGALPDIGNTYPRPREAAQHWRITPCEANVFIHGFEHGVIWTFSLRPNDLEFAKLGVKYYEKFRENA